MFMICNILFRLFMVCYGMYYGMFTPGCLGTISDMQFLSISSCHTEFYFISTITGINGGRQLKEIKKYCLK